MNLFPVRCEGDFVLRHIFPSKQKYVQLIIEKAKKIPEIKRVIIFGSAITWNCGINSDLDIAVEYDKTDNFIGLTSKFRTLGIYKLDIVDYSELKDGLLKSQIMKGIVAYERPDEISGMRYEAL